MKISRSIDIDNAVHTLCLHKDGSFTVVDIENVVRIYTLDELKLIYGFKSNVETAVAYVHNAAISSDRKVVVFYRTEKRELLAFHVPQKKFIRAHKPHNSGTEYVTFTPDNSAYLSGGKDGRVYMWSTANGKRIDTFPHHADAISVIAVSPDARLVATSGYDRVIKITNRSFRNNKYRLISHKAVPTTLTFLSEQRLLSTDKEGEILIWDIIKSVVIKRLEKSSSHITAVAVTQDEQFLFVCTIQGEVNLYDLKEKVELKQRYLHALAGITAVTYDEHSKQLICGLVNGTIAIYDFAKEAEKFSEHLKNKSFLECYKMLEEDPMLQYDPLADELESIFQTYYKGAKKLLMAEQTEKAASLMEPFKSSSAKRLLVQKLFNDFKLYKRFSEAAKAGKFAISYSLANEYTELKTTPIYESMEKRWQKIMLTARTIPVNKEYEGKLRQLFIPYIGVPGKSIIMNTMYANGNTVQLFQKEIGNKNFFNAFQLVSNYPYLKNMEEYDKLLALGETLEERMLESYYTGDYPEAVKLADQVSVFPDKKEKADSIREQSDTYATAMSYYAEQKIADVYNLIEQYPYLADAEIGADAEKKFKEIAAVAERYAVQRDVASIKSTMKDFIKIRSKVPSIVHIIKVAYLGQIEELCIKKSADFTKAVEKYMECFGYDEMLGDELSQLEGRCSINLKEKPETRQYRGTVSSLPDQLL